MTVRHHNEGRPQALTVGHRDRAQRKKKRTTRPGIVRLPKMHPFFELSLQAS